MGKYKETRRLSAYALRALCIEHSWYTLGDNEEYDHLLTDLAGSKPHLDTGDIIAIAGHRRALPPRGRRRRPRHSLRGRPGLLRDLPALPRVR